MLIGKCFRSPSRDSEKHDTGELFYFLIFAAGEDEHFTVCLHYFDSILAGSLKMLREKFLWVGYVYFHMFYWWGNLLKS